MGWATRPSSPLSRLLLDDVARRKVLAEFRKVLESEGEEAALRYLQRAAGKNAPQVIRAMYDQGLLREVRSVGEWERIFERGVRHEAGLEVPHLIEQRFAERLGLDPANIPSVVLTKEEHRAFTNAWRKAIGYRGDLSSITTVNATPADVWAAAQEVYAKSLSEKGYN